MLYKIGPRFNVKYNNITTYSNGFELPWVNEIRYLGIYYLVKSRSFKCSFDHAKRAFYRSLNAVSIWPQWRI